MKKERKLWLGFAAVILLSFGVLGYYGFEIYQESPPIPEKVISTDNQVVFTGKDIKEGQNIWQSIGGQEVGSIWGHGAYVAPDWTADWLHREAVFILNGYAQSDFNKNYDDLNKEQQAALKVRLQKNLRTNTYDKKSNTITITEERIAAFKYLSNYYKGLFTDDPNFDKLRSDYAIPKNTIKSDTRMQKMNAFFFWATWATVTERPGEAVSYTHNWPSDELVGNTPTTSLYTWSGVSIILLILCIGILVFYHVRSGEEESIPPPSEDPLLKQGITPSMHLIKKYFWVVSLLMVVQMLLGIVTAHYGVEGDGFYGIPLDQILPYSVTRTWHTQLAIFWIATAWLATGLYIAPAVSGKDPKFQKFGVNFLFVALLIIVVGSMFGQWLGVMQKLDLIENFWFGHQGYEYVDLGRFWQIFLLVGLFLWLALMVRPLLPVIKKKTAEKNLIIMFLISCTAIALFYAAGLMWGRQTNLAIAEYWRWWVVHLWVEGFFEVFATVVIAFLFVRLGLLKTKTATANVLFATIIFMSGGILGTFHHLYFSGTPTAIMALGATFSALEIVPLTLIGYEAYHNYKLSKATKWLEEYKWPIYFMVAVAFWNFLGAGVFGFIINPPIALYYVQGLNTTPLHGHTALFGVYGMLGIGLMLFVLRSLYRNVSWNEKILKITFWSLNIGLLAMALLSLLPIGIWQALESMEKGMWYARSAELMQHPTMVVLKWMRSIGDIIFAVGIVTTCWFVFDLTLKNKIVSLISVRHETQGTTQVGKLVAQNYRTATIFSKYDIDFCSKGEKTIDEVCLNKGIDTEHLLERLNEVMNTTDSQDIDYQSWSLELLADHIENTHHQYVKRNIPTLLEYLNKLCKVHGRRHPELYKINDLFKETATHLNHHMIMEETTLFPIVRKMTKNLEADINLVLPDFGSVENPISKMMQEHDNEGENFKKIATLSNNFTPPNDACATYKVTFSLLKEFEADLLLHIHLENNILFPKAIAIEKGIVGNDNLAFFSNN